MNGSFDSVEIGCQIQSLLAKVCKQEGVIELLRLQQDKQRDESITIKLELQMSKAQNLLLFEKYSHFTKQLRQLEFQLDDMGEDVKDLAENVEHDLDEKFDNAVNELKMLQQHLDENSKKIKELRFGEYFESFEDDLVEIEDMPPDELIEQQHKLVHDALGCYIDKMINIDGFKAVVEKVQVEALVGKFYLLHDAAANGLVECLKVLLKAIPTEHHETKNNENLTALHYAADMGNADCCKELLRDSTPEYREQQDNCKCTPLHFAARHGYVDCVKVLLKDARPKYQEMRSMSGLNALGQASANDRVDCIKVLLKNSEPKYRELKTDGGSTPLHWAAFKGHVAAIKVLLEDYDVEYREMRNDESSTALHEAAREGRFDCVRALLDGARPGYRTMTACIDDSAVPQDALAMSLDSTTRAVFSE
eukprot:TRINITY_DN4678_c0_g1_i3.p1 TRINITY_DN4678_c0_g1~~TRINITY_DN4678_c0_g1_i3.p1  ORF type:complete len:421 (-),score=104.72 TRINITY_DN4678_c0_g1_i3:183-1445(-)